MQSIIVLRPRSSRSILQVIYKFFITVPARNRIYEGYLSVTTRQIACRLWKQLQLTILPPQLPIQILPRQSKGKASWQNLILSLDVVFPMKESLLIFLPTTATALRGSNSVMSYIIFRQTTYYLTRIFQRPRSTVIAQKVFQQASRTFSSACLSTILQSCDQSLNWIEKILRELLTTERVLSVRRKRNYWLTVDTNKAQRTLDQKNSTVCQRWLRVSFSFFSQSSKNN